MTYSSIRLLALVLAIVLHFVAGVTFYFYHPLQDASNMENNYIEITLEEETEPEPIEEEEETIEQEIKEEETPKETQALTNRASNKSESEENEAPSRTSSQAEDSKDKEENTSSEDINKDDPQSEEDGITPAHSEKETKDITNSQQGKTIGQETNANTEKDFSGKSNVSFVLHDRHERNLLKPIYMCPRGGTIVVDISVNRQGEVVKAKVNEDLTDLVDECLFNAAENFAKESTFTMDFKAPFRQSGTITYIFQPQK